MGDEDPSIKTRYAEAVERLNSLQSNASVLARAAAASDAKRRQPENMREMRLLLERLDLTTQDLSKLSFIHVSGTKGKGSVCAFTESLLRHRGLKTGFYSSPHLVEVRERIRINGRPLSKEKFVEHFWFVFNKLEETRAKYEDNMPPYFRFLTLMGLRVFLVEAVDVAVMEVGVGGRFDCTNIIPAPAVCGITPLGFDHVNVLGNTIEEIAWNKAGIMKPGCDVAVTWADQPAKALPVLQREAEAAQCRLAFVPALQDYPVPAGTPSPPTLGIHGPPQLLNASLALQLAELWWLSNFLSGTCDFRVDGSSPFPLDAVHLEALAKTEWPGRCSIVDRGPGLRLHLDGAHTLESLELCVDWFSKVSHSPRIAVFNVTGGRDSKPLLHLLQQVPFDLVIFCPNMIHSSSANRPDCTNGPFNPRNLEKVAASRNVQMKVCETLLDDWHALRSNNDAPEHTANASTLVLPSVADVLALLDTLNGCSGFQLPRKLLDGGRVDVLVTGSLHLVGNFYALVHPDMNS